MSAGSCREKSEREGKLGTRSERLEGKRRGWGGVGRCDSGSIWVWIGLDWVGMCRMARGGGQKRFTTRLSAAAAESNAKQRKANRIKSKSNPCPAHQQMTAWGRSAAQLALQSSQPHSRCRDGELAGWLAGHVQRKGGSARKCTEHTVLPSRATASFVLSEGER